MTPLFLALSGGGATAGACHTGVLLELDRAGIPVAGLAGVSGGALVASPAGHAVRPQPTLAASAPQTHAPEPVRR